MRCALAVPAAVPADPQRDYATLRTVSWLPDQAIAAPAHASVLTAALQLGVPPRMCINKPSPRIVASPCRLETNKLRNTAKLFAHLLSTDAIPWAVLQASRLHCVLLPGRCHTPHCPACAPAVHGRPPLGRAAG